MTRKRKRRSRRTGTPRPRPRSGPRLVRDGYLVAYGLRLRIPEGVVITRRKPPKGLLDYRVPERFRRKREKVRITGGPEAVGRMVSVYEEPVETIGYVVVAGRTLPLYVGGNEFTIIDGRKWYIIRRGPQAILSPKPPKPFFVVVRGKRVRLSEADFTTLPGSILKNLSIAGLARIGRSLGRGLSSALTRITIRG